MSDSRTRDTVVVVEGVALSVQRIAPGGRRASAAPALVFLHDSLGCIETWRDFPAEVADRAGLDAVVYDRQGYGRSAPLSSAVRSVDYLAKEVPTLMTLLDELRVERAVLFGHSDGGSIALLAAARHPDRVAAVITEGAHVFVEEETLAGIREARLLFERTNLGERLARYHGDKVEAMASAWIDTWLSEQFQSFNIEAEVAAAQCPALIIQGELDEYGTQAQVEAIVAGFGGRATALIIPGVGHTPHREARDVVLESVSRFLDDVLGAAEVRA